MASTEVYLEEIEIATRTNIEIQPYKGDSDFITVCIKDGNFKFTDKHLYKILKEFEEDDLDKIFNVLKGESQPKGYQNDKN